MTEQELKTLSRINSIKAWKHFYPEGKGIPKRGYVLHHKDPSWRKNDPERYAQWNIDDLVMMTRSEHQILHTKGKKKGPLSEEIRQKISKTLMGHEGHPHTEEVKKYISEKLKGIKHSEEHNKKISIAKIGSTPWNKGKTYKCDEIAKFRTGIQWWNNGEINRQFRECPGEGWVRGMIKRNA